jgi:two-component system sensor histidine kinase KdpD
MTEEYQPDPDELLKAIQREENKQNLGKLKIFFGMSAGVGKTYAMLEEAKRRLQDGLHIIIGTINTHGRKETEELLKGIPLIPERWVKYKDTVFEEMDLEAILQQKPALVLVDELAHTNVPGSRHPKRWQDVIELLDAGIDVYTTLNVQHVESRKDLVESFAGIQIRETVPDLILERASTIELVDISPAELLERLKEGKVYLGDQSQIAARNFFKEDTLTALREIALRFTAEKVDHDLHSILSQGKGWKTREKLMVAISPSPFSQQLIRKTRRRAFELDATWIAVYVDLGNILSDEEQTHLTNHLNLAQELGAEVITTPDNDIAAAILRIARLKNVTQLIIGRSDSHRKWHFFQKSLIDRLEEASKDLDIVVLRQDKSSKPSVDIYPASSFALGNVYHYVISIVSILGVSILGFLFLPLIGYRGIGFIFLLSIVLLSLFVGQGPIFLAAILSTLSWDYFFIPPPFAFTLTNPQDYALMFIYFSTTTIIGILTSRIHKQDEVLKLRENKVQHLYEIEREIANARNYQYLRLNVTSHLQSMFNGRFDILVKKEGENQLIFDSQLPLLQQEKEQAVAQWVLQNGKIAGWSTSTLPSVKGLYLPIQYSQDTMGVLVYNSNTDRPISIPEINFLQTVAQQMGISLERYLFEERIAHQTYMAQAEKLHFSLLRSVSNRFYTPLNQIVKASQQLNLSLPHKEHQQYLQLIEQASRNLHIMIDNLLSFAELESGFVKLEKSKQNIQDFIGSCVKKIEPLLDGHLIRLSLPETPIFIDFDSHLMEEALKQLLIYAIFHSSPQSPIYIEGREEQKNFKILITNEDSSIEPELLEHMFDKSYQLSVDAKYKNEQLGFAIAHAVMNIHQGKIEVKNRKEGGIILSLAIPL